MTIACLGRLNRRRFVTSSVIGGAAVLMTGQPLRASPKFNHSVTRRAQDSSSTVPMFRGNPARTGVMPGPGPDAANGVETIWRFATDDEIGSSPAVVDGVVYVGSDDGNFYAVNAKDGSARWRFGTGDFIESSPAVVDGVVYAGSSDKNLYAVNAQDGSARWRFAADGAIGSAPAVVDGVVYIGSEDKNLYAVNAKDGTERWRFATGGDIYSSSPAVVDGVVFVGSADKNLYAVNAKDGTERWRFATGGGIGSSPAVVDGVVYVGSSGGNLYAINAKDGTARWWLAVGNLIESSPAVVDGVVYVGSGTGGNGGALYAIGARVPRLSVGGTARVTEKTPLRGGPAASAVERTELKQGTIVTITGDSVTAGDVVWWPVTVNETGAQGWAEASQLAPLTSGPEPSAAP